jgi:hypothetical protein
MEAIFLFEKYVDFQRTALRYIPDDRIFEYLVKAANCEHPHCVSFFRLLLFPLRCVGLVYFQMTFPVTDHPE